MLSLYDRLTSTLIVVKVGGGDYGSRFREEGFRIVHEHISASLL